MEEYTAKLHLLFETGHPLTLTHDDLCEMNFIVDADTHKLNGVIDWADARILPFRLRLSAVQSVLGFMDSRGWHYHDDRAVLEQAFWTEFEVLIGASFASQKKPIETARAIGVLVQHGFVWQQDKMVPATEANSDLRYLDAFSSLPRLVEV